jgi:hypothetical protein
MCIFISQKCLLDIFWNNLNDLSNDQMIYPYKCPCIYALDMWNMHVYILLWVQKVLLKLLKYYSTDQFLIRKYISLKAEKVCYRIPGKKLRFLYQSHCCITEGGTRTSSLEGHRLTKSCTYHHMVQLSRHLPTVKMTTPYAPCTKVRNGIDKNS